PLFPYTTLFRSCSASDFVPGGFFVYFHAARPALNFLLRATGNDYQSVKALGCASFQNECGFDNCNCFGIALAGFLQPLLLLLNYGRMHDSVQFLDARGLISGSPAEGDLRQMRAIDRAIRI